jgi:hypothetical protein
MASAVSTNDQETRTAAAERQLLAQSTVDEAVNCCQKVIKVTEHNVYDDLDGFCALFMPMQHARKLNCAASG